MSGSGFDSMIDTHKYDDLSRMYRLFIMVSSGIACMKKALKDSVVRRGQEINRTTSEPIAQEVDQDEPSAEASAKGKGKAKARPTAVSQTLTLALKWVQDVLDLKDQFDQLWRQSLQSDRTLESALNDVRPISLVAAYSSLSI